MRWTVLLLLGAAAAFSPPLNPRLRLSSSFRSRLRAPASIRIRRSSPFCLINDFNSFYQQGVEFCQIAEAENIKSGEAENAVPEQLGPQSLGSPAPNLTDHDFVWVGKEPSTAQGAAWRRLCHQVEPGSNITFAEPEASRLMELPLFTISRILLPGADFPLQIWPEKTHSQAMFRQLREDGGSFGVVFWDEEVQSFSRIGCEAALLDTTEFDDGRLILETSGLQRFRILELVQMEPVRVAVVEILADSQVPRPEQSTTEDQRLELECWRTLLDVAWLCVEVYSKSSWLPLLMNINGKQHPLSRMKPVAPPEEDTDPHSLESTKRRERLSWHLVSTLRKGIPGLWDIDLTGGKLEDSRVLELMQSRNSTERLSESLNLLNGAKSHLRQHQRLKDMMDNRTVAEE